MNLFKPQKFSGKSHIDSRGALLFNNQAEISEFKRMYVIENSQEEPLRGWHGHRVEAKGFICLSGKVRIGAVEVDDWTEPSEGLAVYSDELTERSMDFIYIPGGYANAILSLEPGSRVLVLSSSTLQDSLADDYRFPANFWGL